MDRHLHVWSFAFIATIMTANAQFKVVGPPPYPPTVARQKIKTLLEGADAANRAQTAATLSGLLSWYRDLIDEELIAAWQKDSRANLTELMEPLSDSRVASAVVEFSWRQRRQAVFSVTYAPMFVNLMTRFPESAQPFLNDLLGNTTASQHTPDLSQPEAETVCRILLDMPDVGTWKKSALDILPHYRRVAESLLVQDLHGSDQEKSYAAQRWLAELRSDVPGVANERVANERVANDPQSLRRSSTRSRPAVNDSTPTGDQTAAIAQRRASEAPVPSPAAVNSTPVRPSLQTAPRPPSPPTAGSSPPPYSPPLYSGPKSGTLECGGGPIPQNAEYVFRNVPLVKMQLDYDTKTWDARLAPGDGQTQKLIVRNKSSGPQKHCVVHWTVIP
jgi:hypothetical protein